MNQHYNINDHIKVNNKHTGQIVKFIWNNLGIIVKLDNDPYYINETIVQYGLLDKSIIPGHHIFTIANDKFEKINKPIDQSKKENTQMNNIYHFNNYDKYNDELKNNENYKKYIDTQISKIFNLDDAVKNTNSSYDTNDLSFMHIEDSMQVLGEDNIDEIKSTLMIILKKFLGVDKFYIYDFKHTSMYEHLSQSDFDEPANAKELIIKIKNALVEIQKTVTIDGIGNIYDRTNLFDFIKFDVVNGYIEITNRYNDSNFRVIPEIPEIVILKDQIGKPINYKFLTAMLLDEQIVDNKTSLISEIEKIFLQEILLCMQPEPNYLLWAICRLIVCWYANKKLFDNIFKIKILINMYRARGDTGFNKDNGVYPQIVIVPKYGNSNALQVASELALLFTSYNNLFLSKNCPTYFSPLDDLLYYTNGSVNTKRLFDIIEKKDNIKINIFDSNNTNNVLNKTPNNDGV